MQVVLVTLSFFVIKRSARDSLLFEHSKPAPAA
jgi:hypothetical protein